MHLNRSTSALAIFSLLSLASSLPFNFLEPLVRRATYSVVPVDGGSAASTGAAGQGDATIYETIIVTAAPATKTLVDTIAITDYIVSTEIVQLSGIVQTVLVTVTPPAATVTTTGYSIIDVSASQVTITTTASPSLSSSSSTTLSAASVSTTLSPSAAPATTSSLESSSHTYDNGQWHTYYPSWNASSTSIVSQPPATTSFAATPTQSSLKIMPPVGPGGGYGDFGKRAAPTVIPGVYGYLGKWERLLRKRVASLV